MGFWIWMFIVAILCPTIMIVAGLYFRKSAPKKINAFFGYRTAKVIYCKKPSKKIKGVVS